MHSGLAGMCYARGVTTTIRCWHALIARTCIFYCGAVAIRCSKFPLGRMPIEERGTVGKRCNNLELDAQTGSTTLLLAWAMYKTCLCSSACCRGTQSSPEIHDNCLVFSQDLIVICQDQKCCLNISPTKTRGLRS